jgi:threonine dehydrogenase-like Zn-dependent dehydrogenase
MKAVVFHDVGDIRVEDVKTPVIEQPTDAIVQLTASAICGTDLHMVRGTMPGMKPGTILGHEGVGVVAEVGSEVRNFTPGDRVVICSTIGCGYCSYCRSGYYSQCDYANPNAKGTAFFGGPEEAGGFNGMQAEFVRVPFANVGMVKLPPQVSDDQAILISDIFPTGYFGAEMAEIKQGDTVAVFGCGPVGQFTIASAFHLGAGRVFAVDCIPSRLEMARAQSAEIIDFNVEDPVSTIGQFTGNIGVDRAIDAVGIDALAPHSGPAAERISERTIEEREEEVRTIAPETHSERGNWVPGDSPFQALDWAVDALAKAGTLSIVGVYPEKAEKFPIGKAMMKNLTIRAGNCNHRRYVPMLIELVRAGVFDPTAILTQVEALTTAVEAYRKFDVRQPGWMKVELVPA